MPVYKRKATISTYIIQQETYYPFYPQDMGRGKLSHILNTFKMILLLKAIITKSEKPGILTPLFQKESICTILHFCLFSFSISELCQCLNKGFFMATSILLCTYSEVTDYRHRALSRCKTRGARVEAHTSGTSS